MEPKPNKVVVVFDPQYGDRLVELAKCVHVWAVESPDNRRAAQSYIEGLKTRSLTPGEAKLSLTLSARKCLDSDFLETLQDHHGEYAQQIAWDELEVIGAALDFQTEKVLNEWGFHTFEQTPDGFLARRRSP
jgi:hypothetical protein